VYALWGIGLLSLILAQDKIAGVWVLFRISQGISLIWIMNQLRLNFRALILCFLWGSVLQAWIGFYQFVSQEDLFGANKWLGVSAHDPTRAGTSVVDTGERRWLRSYGILPHPNILGGYLMLGWLMAAYWYQDIHGRFAARIRKNRTELEFKKIKIELAGVILCLLILGFGLFSSFSRSAIGALGMGLLFFFFLKKRAAQSFFKKKQGACFVKLFLVLFLLGTSFSLIYWEPVKTRLFFFGRLEERSLAMRQSGYREAWDLFLKHPLGVGLGHYTLVLGDQEQGQTGRYYQPAHNVFLLVLVELGIFGLAWIVWGASLVLWEWRIGFGKRRNSRSILFFSCGTAILFIGFWDHYFWTLYFGQMVGFLILSLFLASKKADWEKRRFASVSLKDGQKKLKNRSY